MEIQIRVCRRLARQRVWWVLQLPCAADRPGDGHIPGLCSKCPRVDCLELKVRSCSWRQFTTSRVYEDVSATQNARSDQSVSDMWSRRNFHLSLDGRLSHRRRIPETFPGTTKTRRRRLQTPLAAADQDGRNCGQTVLLAGSQPQAKSDVPAVIARCDPNFAPKDVREVAWARIAHVEPDFDHTLRRLSQ